MADVEAKYLYKNVLNTSQNTILADVDEYNFANSALISSADKWYLPVYYNDWGKWHSIDHEISQLYLNVFHCCTLLICTQILSTYSSFLTYSNQDILHQAIQGLKFLPVNLVNKNIKSVVAWLNSLYPLAIGNCWHRVYIHELLVFVESAHYSGIDPIQLLCNNLVLQFLSELECPLSVMR